MTDERGTFTTPTTNPNPTAPSSSDDAAAIQNATNMAAMAVTRATQAADTANTTKTGLDQLLVTAATFQTTVTTAEQTHQRLQSEIDALSARLDTIQLTPGPAGDSAYQIARNHGYGGTETQWLATLRGADGKDGVGTPGKDGQDGQSITGPAGTSIYAGNGAPTPSIGKPGDVYIDVTTGDIYTN